MYLYLFYYILQLFSTLLLKNKLREIYRKKVFNLFLGKYRKKDDENNIDNECGIECVWCGWRLEFEFFILFEHVAKHRGRGWILRCAFFFVTDWWNRINLLRNASFSWKSGMECLNFVFQRHTNLKS